jgi:hypothetical protein
MQQDNVISARGLRDFRSRLPSLDTGQSRVQLCSEGIVAQILSYVAKAASVPVLTVAVFFEELHSRNTNRQDIAARQLVVEFNTQSRPDAQRPGPDNHEGPARPGDKPKIAEPRAQARSQPEKLSLNLRGRLNIAGCCCKCWPTN